MAQGWQICREPVVQQPECDMIAGALGSSGAIEKGMTKGRTYQTVKGLTAAFDEKNGSHICKELKGIETGKVLRSCDGCIEDAVRIAERLFS